MDADQFRLRNERRRPVILASFASATSSPPPTTESAFHMVELTRLFLLRPFSFLEKAFHIAKFSAYPIEK
ncbi:MULTISPECIES: hypothetical protein [unclassified Cupriavidus]|uniref:hypothetical protein n=1 Tax=unclassified Cupriavidus TaxID=2640874 RepID=UPI00295E6FC7|nr:hypothetical protein [Cupriavidus sp. TA19]